MENQIKTKAEMIKQIQEHTIIMVKRFCKSDEDITDFFNLIDNIEQDIVKYCFIKDE